MKHLIIILLLVVLSGLLTAAIFAFILRRKETAKLCAELEQPGFCSRCRHWHRGDERRATPFADHDGVVRGFTLCRKCDGELSPWSAIAGEGRVL
jgi:hypothetical protein